MYGGMFLLDNPLLYIGDSFLKKLLCCVGGQVNHLVDYQLEVDKGKLTAVSNFES